ncbi:MAG: c-type cytochrome [Gammaproteobacteria bacterium]
MNLPPLRRLLPGLLVTAAAGGVALLFVVAGRIPVAASTGHSAIASWFLHSAMREAVQAQAADIAAPPLDDPILAQRAAPHFDLNCAPCHGAPGVQRSLTAAGATPKPPSLTHKVGEWRARELFWIVKHGIKYTGMPAWPALEREDEVWAMVAFLERLPQLSPTEYRRLAGGAAVAGRGDARLGDLSSGSASTDIEVCTRCHGSDGNGTGDGAFPRIAGQPEEYLFAALAAYASGARHSGIMQVQALALDGQQMRALARHYAAQPPRAGRPELGADAGQRLARGRRIAEQGLPERGVPACDSCHGAAPPRNPAFPLLRGQHASYLVLQLQLFRQERRGGSPYAGLMSFVADRLDERTIRDVALYYATRPAPSAR